MDEFGNYQNFKIFDFVDFGGKLWLLMVEMRFGFVLGFAVELRPAFILRLRVTWVTLGVFAILEFA